MHAEAVAAVDDAARLLASLGHHVEEAAPDIDGPLLARCYLHIYFGQVPAAMARPRCTMFMNNVTGATVGGRRPVPQRK